MASYKQYRSGFKQICEVFTKLKLGKDHIDLLGKTPFALLFKALQKGQISQKKRNDDIIDQIIKAYDPRQQKFKVGGKYCGFRQSDIRMLFGLKHGEVEVKITRSTSTKSEFTERYFQGQKTLTGKKIIEVINEVIESEEPEKIKDTVRLLCLLLFQKLFFTTTGEVLGWSYVDYVEDLKRLSTYDWSSFIHRKLLDSLDKKKDDPQTVNGCTTAVWFWFCEHCKCIQPKEHATDVEENNGIPRVTKWELTELNDLFSRTKLSDFTDDHFIWDDLIPTREERRLLGIKETKKKVHEDSDFEEQPATPLKRKRDEKAECSTRKKAEPPKKKACVPVRRSPRMKSKEVRKCDEESCVQQLKGKHDKKKIKVVAFDGVAPRRSPRKLKGGMDVDKNCLGQTKGKDGSIKGRRDVSFDVEGLEQDFDVFDEDQLNQDIQSAIKYGIGNEMTGYASTSCLKNEKKKDTPVTIDCGREEFPAFDITEPEDPLEVKMNDLIQDVIDHSCAVKSNIEASTLNSPFVMATPEVLKEGGKDIPVTYDCSSGKFVTFDRGAPQQTPDIKFDEMAQDFDQEEDIEKEEEKEKDETSQKVEKGTQTEEPNSYKLERIGKFLKAQRSALMVLRNSNEKSTEKKQTMVKKMKRLQERLVRAKKMQHEIGEQLEQKDMKIEKQKTEYEEQIDNLAGEIAILSVDLERATTKNKDLEQRNYLLQEEIVKLQSDNKAKHAKIVSQSDVIKNLQKDLSEAKEPRKETIESKEEGQRSMVKRIKHQQRTPTVHDDAFVYTGTNLRNAININSQETDGGDEKIVVRKTLKIKTKEAYECGQYLDDDSYNKITSSYEKNGDWGVIWNEDAVVKVIHLINVLEGKFISENVINAFTSLIEEPVETEGGTKKFTIFQTNIKLYCDKYEKEKTIKPNLEKKVKHTFKNCEMILFPICCKGTKREPYHWILLTYEPGEGYWKLYNSMNCSKTEAKAFEEECAKVQTCLWEYLFNNAPENNMEYKAQIHKVEVVKNIPKQENTKSNCAVYVMYYIQQLVQNQKVGKIWKENEVKKFTAMVVNDICKNGVA